MGVKDRLKTLWKPHRGNRTHVTDRERAEERVSELLGPAGGRAYLDEGHAMMIGMGLEPFGVQREWWEEEEMDCRFLINPSGEGCSRSFENPSSTDTTDRSDTNLSTPTSSNGDAPWMENNEDKGSSSFSSSPRERESVFDPSTWSGPEHDRIDWTKGKRKGKATDDDDNDEDSTESQDPRLNGWFTRMKVERLVPKVERTRRLVAGMRKRART